MSCLELYCQKVFEKTTISMFVSNHFLLIFVVALNTVFKCLLTTLIKFHDFNIEIFTLFCQHDQSNSDEPQEEPNPIYIQTPVDADSQILVADTNETAEEIFDENDFEEDPAVVLSGRMTLSLISPRIGSPSSGDRKSKTDSTENLSSEPEKSSVDKDMKVEVSNIVVMEKMEH